MGGFVEGHEEKIVDLCKPEAQNPVESKFPVPLRARGSKVGSGKSGNCGRSRPRRHVRGRGRPVGIWNRLEVEGGGESESGCDVVLREG